MALKVKIILSMIALPLALFVASVFWILSIYQTIIPKTQLSVQQLSVKLLNETLQFESRALFIVTKINQSMQFNSPFIIRNVIFNQFTNNTLRMLDQTEIHSLELFLAPLYKSHRLEYFTILCKDKQEYLSIGEGSQQFTKEFINWTSLYEANLIINENQIKITVGNQKCNIQVYYGVRDFIISMLKNAEFVTNQVQSRTVLLDAHPYNVIWQENNETNLSKILDVDNEKTLQILKFNRQEDEFGCLKQEPKTISYESNTENRLIKYIQFSISDLHYKCNQQYSVKLTYMMIISLNQFHEHLGTQDLNYDRLNYATNSYACLIILLIFYFYRVAVKVALSFEVPIERITEIINEPYKFHYENSSQRMDLRQQLHNQELLQLYDSLLLCVIMHQFHQKQQLLNNNDKGAEYLQNLCQIKSFYKFCQNKWMVSVCGNNMAMIHYKNKRYSEALNQLAESIMIGNKELTSLKQIEKLRKKIERNHFGKSILNRLQSYIINKFAGKSSNIIDQGRFKSQEEQNRACLSMSIHKSMALKNSIEDKQQCYQSIGQQQSQEYRQNYKRDKDQLTLCLFFRKYAYIIILFKFCINSDSKLFNETIQNIKQLEEEISQKQKWKKSKYLTLMRIKAQIKLFYCYMQLKMYESAYTTNQFLLGQYDYYLGLEDDQINYHIGYNTFENIPISYMQVQLALQKIVLMKFNNQNYQAALESANLFKKLDDQNQKVQLQLLKILEEIFVQYYLDKDLITIQREVINQEQQKVIILIDYSKTMAFNQIQISQTYCKYILQRVYKSTSVGLYLFNEILFEAFKLQNQMYTQDLYSQILDKLLLPPGGTSQLFEVIKQSVKLFRNSDETKFENYLCLFTEFQSQNIEQNFYEIRTLLHFNKIKLVVFQIQNSNRNIQIAQHMSDYCNGLLIQNEKQITNWLDSLGHTKVQHSHYFEFW
ncbi:unnamed protein product (macronuclear) [Paramecium tetraurelia]|uniref:VWFA domain-containing protein n=1 Tax=Paramecium tetraurelia TaxID=5888 RepID=A0BQE9_PARTE|nr:uncharacterized protein GSPATT00030995001 [Paramecium tetraurelia]CAK60766.1 unnamed protein product [Paramecium tetraurelia]|eukprot:XP_001428164.1 hypothetical protein (macronuclear) [Paramecium tetraurelia strain d4-2]